MDETDDYRPQWEYHIEFVSAYAHDPQTRDFLATYYPSMKFAKYAAEGALPILNEIGEQGWELVQMQPVWLQNDGSVTCATQNGTNTYLCVFKRLKRPVY